MSSGVPLVAEPAVRRVVVASYNVHRCIGADGVHAPARIAEVLRELDADVIGLTSSLERDTQVISVTRRLGRATTTAAGTIWR